MGEDRSRLKDRGGELPDEKQKKETSVDHMVKESERELTPQEEEL